MVCIVCGYVNAWPVQRIQHTTPQATTRRLTRLPRLPVILGGVDTAIRAYGHRSAGASGCRRGDVGAQLERLEVWSVKVLHIHYMQDSNIQGLNTFELSDEQCSQIVMRMLNASEFIIIPKENVEDDLFISKRAIAMLWFSDANG